jgi:cobalamin biosynthesis protein CobD/CbiB
VKIARDVTLWLVFCAVVALVSLADEIIRHAMLLVPLAIAATAGAYLLGRRHGSGARSHVARRRDDGGLQRKVAELEKLAGRPIDTMIESYRRAQGQYKIPRRRK